MSSREAHELVKNGESSTKRQRVNGNGSQEERLAYLGPPGTYGHQAASIFLYQLLEDSPELAPCSTIDDVWRHPAEYLVLPLNNTIHGEVKETLSCLLERVAAPSSKYTEGLSTIQGDGEARIVADLDLPVEHSLIVRKGTKMEEIEWVKSHEQALGQCSNFLDEELKRATRIPTTSTAAAAASLLERHRTEGMMGGYGAAIASKAVVELYPDGLEILHESIQDCQNNFTRFILLSRHDSTPAEQLYFPSTSKTSQPTIFFALQTAKELSAMLRTMGERTESPPVDIASIYTLPHPEVVDSASRYPRPMVVELESGEDALRRGITTGVRYLGEKRYHCEASSPRRAVDGDE